MVYPRSASGLLGRTHDDHVPAGLDVERGIRKLVPRRSPSNDSALGGVSSSAIFRARRDPGPGDAKGAAREVSP
jgi:hypothetical protein